MDRPVRRTGDNLAARLLIVLTLAALVAAPAAVAARPARGPAPAPAPAGAPAGATLPPDFPSDVPLPPGDLQAASGAGGSWSVLLLVRGSAAATHASIVAFYRAQGFIAETDSILHNAAHRVTIVVENRDHSATATFAAIGVTDRSSATPAQPAAPVTHLAASLTGARPGRATLTLTAARLCWRFDGLAGLTGVRSATVRHGTTRVTLGRRFHRSGCRATPAPIVRAIAARPAVWTVTVATRAEPRGAVRGRLRPA